ncbi:hypothetical protein B4Q13_25620, partial [Lacticaseibacillus rhamnosus]
MLLFQRYGRVLLLHQQRPGRRLSSRLLLQRHQLLPRLVLLQGRREGMVVVVAEDEAEAEDVNRHQRQAEVLGELRDRRVYLLNLERLLGASHRLRVDRENILDSRHRQRSPRGGAQAGEEGVAQHPHEVVELILALDHAGRCEHPREGLLH